MKKHGYRKRGFVPHQQGYMNAKTINVNTVTNVTNVTQVNSVSGRFCGRKRRRDGNDRHERPPKLARFCASGGLLDYDVASRMSDREMCDEAVKVTSYAAKGLARSAGNVVESVERGVCGMSKCLLQIIEGVLGL